jgi:1-acyl-sn-glycerol-3-phosphate acyltransferase
VSAAERVSLGVQRTVGLASGVVWIPAVVGLMRFGLGWQLDGTTAARARYQELCAERRPLLVCANHLTMIDSALVAWALGSPLWYLRHFAALPWNTPERRNFADSPLQRVLVWLMKCVPIERGGDRARVAQVLAQVTHLLAHGESVLVFPEGGRSRSGRVEVENAAYGVGRIVQALPGCRVLCVYVRGARQETFSDLPARGDRFHVATAVLEPTSPLRGLRGERDIARQIVGTLVTLEKQWLDARQ